jgi:hypothetical protein
MVKTKNDPQFEIGATPVSKVGVRKIPLEIEKQTCNIFDPSHPEQLHDETMTDEINSEFRMSSVER